ncbi:MAG: VCBS repeat-containing protein [Oscillospiraceae bacterium]|nr:VCBS repeat-containing protein [Oscillospiraceae bacterium]
MKQLKQIIIAPLLAALAIIGISGCLQITADELYSLPQVSEQYRRLQQHINTVLSQGAEYSPPTGGPNRQSVQLVDINGDGINEVVAFFAFPIDSALRVYIFKMVDDDYIEAEVITGTGSAIESVRYADIDGDGANELIIGWQMSAALKYMSVYAIRDYHAVLLGGTEYNVLSVSDIDEDGIDDIIALRLPSPETGAVAELIHLMADGEIVKSDTRLSNGVDTISRVSAGILIDGVPAIFVDSEGRFGDGTIVTDICVIKDGSLRNVSLKWPSGVSEDTVRNLYNSSDINKEGTIKVPIPRLLQPQSETPYHAIDWYAFNSSGHSRLALTTFHNNNDEWFLILPLDWRGTVSVRREDTVSGERTVVFSYIVSEDGPYRDFLKIHKLTGDMAEEQSTRPGRIVLTSEGAAIYAFELLAPQNSFGLTFDEELIKDNFRLMYSDWLSRAN